MARQQKEVIKRIGVETCRISDGHIKTKITVLFESGKRYATSILGFDERFEKFSIGEEVLTKRIGDSVLDMQKA